MTACSQCNATYATERIYCGKCGNRIGNPCAHCGFINSTDDVTCGMCGRQIDTPRSLKANAQPRERPLNGFSTEQLLSEAKEDGVALEHTTPNLDRDGIRDVFGSKKESER